VPPDLIGRSTPELRRAEGGLQFPLAVIALAFVFGAAAMNSMTAFLVESSVSSGLSPARSAGLLVLGSATGWVARVLIGWRADHRGARHLIVVALLLVCGSVGLWGLSSSRPTVLVIATVVGFTGLGWSGLATYAVVRIQPDRPAGATSAVLAGAFVGAVLGPAIFGHVVARSSYGYAWAMAGAWAFVAAALMLLARRAIRRAHRSP
jgi:predicted MFS family arabinose efflux permease